MEMMSEFQKNALAFGVAKILDGERFNINDFRSLLRLAGCEEDVSARDQAAFLLLHGVSWADMDPEMKRLTREKCTQLLGLTHEVLETPSEHSSQ